MRKLIAVLLLAAPVFADVILAPPPDKTVTRMRITVTTGADDLREGSTVSAFVVLKDGRRIQSGALNCRKNDCDGLEAKSRETLVWTPSESDPFARDEIRRFGLTFESAKGDEWALAALEVDATAGGRTKTLLKLDRPVRYFDGSGSWESAPLVR
jgi:hypothetical protein